MKDKISARLALILAASFLWLAPASSFAAETAHVVLKFVKAKPGGPAAATFMAETCPSCLLGHDPAFARENDKETLIELTVPLRRTLELGFKVAPSGVKRVILETGDLSYSVQGRTLTLPLPPLADDAVTAGEIATHIVEPGMVLRFEHADPARRAGAYAAGDFPNIQRQAANTLEFAQREMIRATGLGEYVALEKLGTIQVMGFDTNYPHGHTDAPPHMHMHLRWPDNTGTQIGHYYIDDHGLLLRNQVGVKGLGGAGQVFGRGQPFTTVDLRGRGAYTHTITPEGWLSLGRAGQPACLIRPVGDGFQTGAVVNCPGRPPVTIKVEDDQAVGVLRVWSNTILETFRYDPETGTMLSPQAPPPVSPSGYPAAQ